MEDSVKWEKIKREVKNRGLKDGLRYCFQKVKSESGGKVFRILLLTNRDSDNVGDQIIEACDISLLECVMKNLGISITDYTINSRAASIVSRAYITKRDEKLLAAARKTIEETDIVVFGGAPMFNYLYQIFYERTAITLELAQHYGKPVIFSAVGIEQYHEDNPKCQRLKAALNLECVKQITTRDDFDKLQKYKKREELIIGKVADPAVFAGQVFAPFRIHSPKKKKKVIGIFILRDNAFEDNQLSFSQKQAAEFWVGMIQELKNRGYQYELLTSGHFSDEAFLDKLIRKYGVKDEKCVFNMNSPEKLVGRISSYDAIISCRLHPSIIAYALDVPSVGIGWNGKVKGFYDSAGYGDRVVEVQELTPQNVADKLEQSMEQGVNRQEDYAMSVYRSLFAALKEQICPDKEIMPYTYQQVLQYMPAYAGTSKEEQEEKDRRKYRRIYQSYNKRGKK